MESLGRLNCMKPMKSKKPDHRESTESESVFTVKYLGFGQLERPGLEDMCNFVYSTCKTQKSKLRDVQKSDFLLSKQEFSILSSQDNHDSPLVFRIRRIQFCGVYQVNPKIFFFTYQFGKTADTVDCHVLRCKTRKEAKTLAKEAAVFFKDAVFSLHKELENNQYNVDNQLSITSAQKSTN